MKESEIQNFYQNKNVFITGGTGFLGIAIVEKILRSCPNVCIVDSFLLMYNLGGPKKSNYSCLFLILHQIKSFQLPGKNVNVIIFCSVLKIISHIYLFYAFHEL